jgi:hypothetical protein
MNWRGVAVALAVVVAGCGSVVGGAGPGGQGADTPAPTLTPAPVPAVTETPVTLPPGVAGNRVTNATTLYEAHTDYIRGRSYTLHVRVEVDSGSSERVFGVETPTRYYRHDRLPGRNFTRYADGDRVYVRSVLGGNDLYASSDDPDRPSAPTVRLSKAFLQLDDVRVAETLVDGELHYELTGSYPVHPTVDSLRDVRIRAVLGPQGFIRSLNTSYVAVSAGTRTNVTRSFAYTDVDSTTVERPLWVEREFNESID